MNRVEDLISTGNAMHEAAAPFRASAGDIRTNWRFILAAALGCAVASTTFYSFGVFLKPLEQEFGWSRSQISAALVISSFTSVLLGPLIGAMIDRWGSRRVGLPGMVIYSCCFASLSLTGPSIWSFWALFAMVSLSLTTITVPVWTTAIASNISVSQRGLAMAMTSCGTSLGMMIVPNVAEFLISSYGWRAAYIGVSVLFAGVSLPLIFIFFRDRARVTPLVMDAVRDEEPAGVRMGLREAARTARFWKIVFIALISSIATLALVTHYVPLVTDAGLGNATAAFAAGLIGIASAMGRLFEGYLLDRIKGPVVGAVSLLLPAVAAFVILFGTVSPTWAIAVALILGAAVGAEINILAYLTSRYFGTYSYGLLFGIVYSMMFIGGGLGPLFAATVYDTTGSYDLVAWTEFPVCILCAVLTLTLGAYPEGEGHGQP